MKVLIQPLLRRLATLDPHHVRIAANAVWVAAFVLVGKLAAAGRDISIAWRYGVGEIVDAYQLAATLVFWLPNTLVAALLIVLVPMLVRLPRTVERQHFLLELQGSAVVLGAAFAVFGVLVEPLLVPYLAGKLSPTSKQFVWAFTLGMAPAASLTLLIGVYAARLMSQEQQVSSLLEGVPALAILVFVFLWPTGSDVSPLLWGTLAGIGVQTAALARFAREADDGAVKLRFSQSSPYWRELYAAIAVMATGQIVMGFITPLDQFTAAQLGEGAIASLGYATRVVGLFLGIGALAFSRAALPVLTRLQGTGQGLHAHSVAMRWAAVMFGLGLLAAGLSWLVAPWAIAILFERGAFTPRDTVVVTDVFRWGVLQIPFYFTSLVLVQLLASQGRYTIIAVFATSNLAVKVLLNLSLSAWMGVAGIALATGLMYAWSAGCLLWAAMRQVTK